MHDGGSKHVAYWGSVLRLARLLFERDSVAAGTDFAMTEVVHCKSVRERGVRRALPICTLLHLRHLLDCAKARVLVAVGSHAMRSLDVAPGEFRRDILPGRITLALPHPGAHLPRGVARGPSDFYSARQRKDIAAFLAR